jgi:hypothetical protein
VVKKLDVGAVLALDESYPQGVEHQVCAHVRHQPPVDHLAAEGVDQEEEEARLSNWQNLPGGAWGAQDSKSIDDRSTRLTARARRSGLCVSGLLGQEAPQISADLNLAKTA